MVNETQDLLDEVHRRIGRNLCRFQQIEGSLKVILPCTSPKEAPALSAARFDEYRREIRSKTLGLLVRELERRLSIPEGFFDRELEKVVDARNRLVHHLFELEGINVLTVEGLHQLLLYLDQQFRETEELFEFVRVLGYPVLLVILGRQSEHDPESRRWYKQLLDSPPPNLEYIDPNDPSRTTWHNSRIVALLRMAELHTETVDGMTLLARAGNFLRRQDPELRPKDYGVGTLTEVLLASGQFEVVRRSNDGGGVDILYRSKQ